MRTIWKILWVEDNCAELEAKVLSLTKSGWEVTFITNVRDAEVAIESDVSEFDCFLIDLKLPFLGPEVVEDRVADQDDRYLGIGLIRKIRARFGEEVPIVVYSVVHDPLVDKELDQLNVKLKFGKGPNTSSRELCSAIKKLVCE